MEQVCIAGEFFAADDDEYEFCVSVCPYVKHRV